MARHVSQTSEQAQQFKTFQASRLSPHARQNREIPPRSLRSGLFIGLAAKRSVENIST